MTEQFDRRRNTDSIERLLGGLEATSHSQSERLETITGQLSNVQEKLGCIPGVKKMVEDHEARVRILEETKNKSAGAAMAAGATGGIVATIATVLTLFGFKT